MRIFRRAVFLLICLLGWFTVEAKEASPLKYCVPVKKIDFNPYREMNDGKDLAYLVLLRSYISLEPSELGVLRKFEFSPDGKMFSGEINSDLKWSDGSALTADQAAQGIAKALPFRTLGKRVSVKKVEVVSSSMFRLTLESEIKNLTGVFREALSTNSRHNRFWPVKFAAAGSPPQVLAKIDHIKGHTFSFSNRTIQFVDAGQCQNVDFTIFADVVGDDRVQFEDVKSPAPSAVTLQLNTKVLNFAKRVALLKWVRTAFANADSSLAVTPVKSFFLMGEPGYSASSNWPDGVDQNAMRSREWTLGYENPLFLDVIKKALMGTAFKVKMVPLPASKPLDAQILASGIQKGRHLILQDIVQWPLVESFLTEAPLTRKSLKVIAERSASTIPPDTTTLSVFETNAIKEASLVPIARRYPIAFSRKNLPIKLVWTNYGELTFATKN